MKETGLPAEWNEKEKTGLQIGFIEHLNPQDKEKVGSTFVFISQTDINIDLPKIWMWEIIIKNDSEEDSPQVQVINFGQEFSRLYEESSGTKFEFVNLAA